MRLPQSKPSSSYQTHLSQSSSSSLSSSSSSSSSTPESSSSTSSSSSSSVLPSSSSIAPSSLLRQPDHRPLRGSHHVSSFRHSRTTFLLYRAGRLYPPPSLALSPSVTVLLTFTHLLYQCSNLSLSKLGWRVNHDPANLILSKKSIQAFQNDF